MQKIAIPPFTRDTALASVQLAENVWNARIADEIALLCSPDCVWRNRGNSFQGRAAIKHFLTHKWADESQGKKIKELWTFTDNRISVRFECEWQQDKTNEWFRAYGNENWEFDANGFMSRRDMSANDIAISANDRRIGRLIGQN